MVYVIASALPFQLVKNYKQSLRIYMTIQTFLIEWLLQGDPAIRWQVVQDLLDAPEKEIRSERTKTLREGWGTQILKMQAANGLFGGGLYNPKWISTTYSLLLLRRIGIPRDTKPIQKSCQLLLEKGLYRDGGINYFKSMVNSETCVTGMVLSLLSYFQFETDNFDQILNYLFQEQLPDGGWNCRRYLGAHHGSFHTTINVLEGLTEYLQFQDERRDEILFARDRAVEFLLQHRLFKSHRTGKVIDSKMTRLSFPPRWRYDILRALDYFQISKIPYDSRMDDALEILQKRKQEEGRWPLQQRYPGRTFFEMEEVGKPSRWNTLRALRVLKRYKTN